MSAKLAACPKYGEKRYLVAGKIYIGAGMNTPVRKFLLVLLFCAGALWAKPKVYLPPVDLQGVHPDYAERLVGLVRQYVAVDKHVLLVDNAQQSDRKLQLRLIRNQHGVIVAFEMRKSKDDSLIWSYSHIAYDANYFIPIVSRVSKEKIR